jgi:hypothetical protein
MRDAANIEALAACGLLQRLDKSTSVCVSFIVWVGVHHAS